MKAQRPSLDIISNLPSCILETILCLVPLQDAARTSVLSKQWRYQWTKIPKLGFYKMFTSGESTDENELPDSEQTIESERKKMGERCKVLYTIYQVLLMRQGPIHEFTLQLEVDKTCVEIDHIISHLSRNNAVKKLKLHLSDEEFGSYYWIPLSIFSLQQLTHLHLYGCDLNLKPTFNGFRSLTSLYMKDVYISTKTLLHLLSSCPLLKTFTMFLHDETMICDDKCTAIELFDSLPVIERLTTWSWITQGFVLPLVSQGIPTVSLIHLKQVSYTCMSNDALYFLAFLMRCSPNLEKIEIEIFDDDDFGDEMMSFIVKAYLDICLEHLNELEMVNVSSAKSDLEFVRFILAKSPKLWKVVLYFFDEVVDKNLKSDNVKISIKLLTCITCGKNNFLIRFELATNQFTPLGCAEIDDDNLVRVLSCTRFF